MAGLLKWIPGTVAAGYFISNICGLGGSFSKITENYFLPCNYDHALKFFQALSSSISIGSLQNSSWLCMTG
jgi:hypothetical protein